MSAPVKMYDRYVIRLGTSEVLIETHLIGAFQKMNGEKFLVFEDTAAHHVYFKKASDFDRAPKPNPPVDPVKYRV